MREGEKEGMNEGVVEQGSEGGMRKVRLGENE